MELGLKRALGVKKAATLQSKACNSSTPAAKTSLKRKSQADRGHTTKKTVNQPIISDPTGSQGIPSPPRHGTGKGLMSARGPIINEPIPQAPLLVRDKQHAIQMAYSIVKDADLDECSERETDTLGDSGLFHLIRVTFFVES